MPDSIYESTETIHLRISDVKSTQQSQVARLRDEMTDTRTDEYWYDPLFLQLLESVYDGVILTHLHGAIVKSNARACEFFQMTAEELRELNVIDLLAGATFEHLQMIHGALGEEKRLFIEAECRRGDESTFPAEITVSILNLGTSTQLCFFVRNISLRKQTEEALQRAQSELVDTAHLAGMAEIATGVLHDVGNLLNSVNISAELMQAVTKTEVPEALRLIRDLIEANRDDLGTFFEKDDQGQLVPQYLAELGDVLGAEIEQLRTESANLKAKVATINDAITTQQEYAKTGLFLEEVELPLVIDDALALQKGSITRHDMKIEKRLTRVPTLLVQKSKLIHALVNLISNAKDAMLGNPQEDRRLLIETGEDEEQVFCRITDNGEGIAQEDLEKIFRHGFTTKKNGHGFGLHTSANFMGEMGGSISVESEGKGKGATFTLWFPLPGAEPMDEETSDG